jgi:hypothetical protein
MIWAGAPEKREFLKGAGSRPGRGFSEGDHKPAEGYHSISMIPFGKNDPLRAGISNYAALRN